MDRVLRNYLVLLAVVLLIIIVVTQNNRQAVDWSDTYSLDNTNPKDLYVFNHEVNKLFPSKHFERSTLTPYEYLAKDNQPINMLVIKQQDNDLIDSILLNRVKAGSNLFISDNFIRSVLMDSLKVEKYSYNYDLDVKLDDSMSLSLTSPEWKDNVLKLKHVNHSFSMTRMNPKTATILGLFTLSDSVSYPSFIRFKYGKGFVFIHNHPEVFTNYELLENPSSAQYVARILSYLPQKNKTVWFVKNQTMNDGKPQIESSLSVLFRYPSLRITWLIFVYGFVIFLIFNAKRRQRVVPVIKQLQNTSVQFVQTIGNLYYQEGKPAKLMEKKIIYFLERIRMQYYLDTSVLDEAFAKKLQLKSQQDKALIDELLLLIRNFRQTGTVTPSELIALSKLIDKFWLIG